MLPLTAWPQFRPHPLLRGPHAQTIGALLFTAPVEANPAARHHVELPDGDSLVLHEDRPADWRRGDRIAILLHGLGGSHESAYMRRAAQRLVTRGVRTMRLDMRGCGAGMPLARLPYHGGRSDDLAAAIRFVHRLSPRSSIALIGYSLGGNILLKLLGECGAVAPAGVDRAIAINPAIDLAECARQIVHPRKKLYQTYFLHSLVRLVEQRRELLPDAPLPRWERPPRTLHEFDEGFTAPICGFDSCWDYYQRSSSARLIDSIRVSTTILTSRDDPLVPFEPFEKLRLPRAVRLVATHHGGHLGFLSSPTTADPDRHWMDWRVVDYCTA